MWNYRKLLLFLLIIPLAAIAGYYLLTFLLVGPADDNFFELKNHDVGTHEVSVEILNSHKNIITDNVATNNRQSGFLLWMSESNNLIDNILIENENSGIYLLPSCSNNTLNGNILSNNVNGLSIEDSSDNFVMNNTFSSNKEYGIFYPFSKNNNTIKENSFSNNKKGDDNLTFFSRPIYITLILLIGTGLAYYLMKKSLLKKALKGLGTLIVVFLIAIVAWYFPFESGLPGNNVEITNFSWYNSSEINETYTQVILLMDINYTNKKAYDYSFAENSQTDVIPTRIQIFSREYKSDEDTEKPYSLIYEEDINLTYQKPFRYETTLNLESNMKHDIQAVIIFKEDYEYPHPYGEYRWEQLGGWQQLISI
jgi:parallel beta-helix repeat protein